MGISSSVVLHFTKDKNALIGILNNNFKYSYCKETIGFGDKEVVVYIPMVSFCDIPLSQIKNHINDYGSYGIALSKDWAKKQKLNPVLYIEKNSYLTASFREMLINLREKGSITKNKDSNSILNLLKYTKNYEGYNSYKEDPNFIFFNEREWRISLENQEQIDSIVVYDEKIENQKGILNKKIDQEKLLFTPNDIKYIIINNDSEINGFINDLRAAKEPFYSDEDIEKLTTRIITRDQIFDDM